ncbi:pyridoxamine 5'-phosphate oxidase [Beauveria bassiana ARSEF 2860]|uniref:Pyridoxamine 5'-phosphate oxidase n=1 Tax=Beauveria bassiana (strain ARSEF 2860) TaxID=655819 RepID=J5JXV6_BEAB2|nr:pyridoxamine 5'-phosphate oxidase [Beauveria bassiana ARSEF 2860]EJP69313.1 pyridoxamine 5'-phosphate oxidase [Beauveria bassiana ARSEF 2860]
MSFSNTSTGDAPADPYTKANADTKVDGPQKIKDFTDFITTSKYGMLTTRQAGSSRLVSRSMALAGTESNGIDLVFQINTESGKTDDIASDPDVNVSFLDPKGSWASVAGRATVVTDRAEVQKYYSPVLKAWLGDLGDGVHDGSENDPRIGLIKLHAETITHNVAEYGAIKTAAKVTAAAVKGKPAEVNSLRYVSEDELKAWRSLYECVQLCMSSLPFRSESSNVGPKETLEYHGLDPESQEPAKHNPCGRQCPHYTCLD